MILTEINKAGMKINKSPKTSSLFFEFCRAEARPQAYFSIKPEDHYDDSSGQVFPSLHKLYIAFADPTEYYFAEHYFLNLAHWREVSTHPLVLPYVEAWREELELKIKADALKSIVEASKGNTKDAIQAARYILQQSWFKNGNTGAKQGRGRPTNAKNLDAPSRDEKTVHDDFKRILVDLPRPISKAIPKTDLM